MQIGSLIWIILFAPITGFLLLSLFGKQMGKKACGGLAVATVTVSFVAGVMATLQVSQHGSQIIAGPDWISVAGLNIPFEFLADPLSMTMTLIITGVGALIHLYSTAYMAEDREVSRFFTYMNLFVAAMLLLVLGNNLLLLFIGWEGVGLCSYLLIGFWYRDLSNARAANKAFIVNRIGDWGLMLGLFLIVAVLAQSGAHVEGGRYLSYDQIEGPLLEILGSKPALATTIALLLFVGAAGKSAQFPLYVWLPDAMAGPTPVSALIHAATMVTSGVFLLNRMHFVFELSPVASAVICMVGAFTAAFAALIAFGQTDIKKVLAYSTVSQLGFMFIACGSGAYWAGMFHVATHACFKALLFLGAGAVIYSMSHSQDMRKYGALRKYLPITCYTMCVAWLAISGVPMLSGYFSKEAILGNALASSNAHGGDINFGPIAGWIGLASAALTAAYMTRLMSLTFFGKDERWRSLSPSHDHSPHAVVPAFAMPDDPNDFFLAENPAEDLDEHHDLEADHTPKEAPISMTGVLIALAILAIASGYINQDGAFQKWLYPSGLSYLPPITEAGALPAPLWVLSSIAAFGGILFALTMYRRGLPKDQGLDEKAWTPWRILQREQFGFDHFVTSAAIDGGREIATVLDVGIERGLIGNFTGGLAWFAVAAGNVFKSLQTGYVRLYALMMLLGSVVFIGWFVYLISHLGGTR